MNKEIKKLQKIKRKSFLPTFLITLVLWLFLGIVFIYVDPETGWAVPLFTVLVFSSVFFTSSILLVNRRWGFLVGLAATLMILFRFWGVGTLINYILLIGVLTAFEIYSFKKQ